MLQYETVCVRQPIQDARECSVFLRSRPAVPHDSPERGRDCSECQSFHSFLLCPQPRSAQDSQDSKHACPVRLQSSPAAPHDSQKRGCDCSACLSS
eukprot:3938291-Rhodomonas_salina.1